MTQRKRHHGDHPCQPDCEQYAKVMMGPVIAPTAHVSSKRNMNGIIAYMYNPAASAPPNRSANLVIPASNTPTRMAPKPDAKQR